MSWHEVTPRGSFLIWKDLIEKIITSTFGPRIDLSRVGKAVLDMSTMPPVLKLSLHTQAFSLHVAPHFAENHSNTQTHVKHNHGNISNNTYTTCKHMFLEAWVVGSPFFWVEDRSKEGG